MLSPDCYGGCADRPDNDPFHYYYHVKSGEVSRQYPGDTLEKQQHQRAAAWLREHDLQADPYLLASRIYQEGLCADTARAEGQIVNGRPH